VVPRLTQTNPLLTPSCPCLWDTTLAVPSEMLPSNLRWAHPSHPDALNCHLLHEALLWAPSVQMQCLNLAVLEPCVLYFSLYNGLLSQILYLCLFILFNICLWLEYKFHEGRYFIQSASLVENNVRHTVGVLGILAEAMERKQALCINFQWW
jgi:hypothetical protein